jgi:hypothetical protein
MKVAHSQLFPKHKKSWFTPFVDFLLGALSMVKFNFRKPKPNSKVRITHSDDEIMFREKFRKELAAKKELELEKQLAKGVERKKKSVHTFNNNYNLKRKAQ